MLLYAVAQTVRQISTGQQFLAHRNRMVDVARLSPTTESAEAMNEILIQQPLLEQHLAQPLFNLGRFSESVGGILVLSLCLQQIGLKNQIRLVRFLFSEGDIQFLTTDALLPLGFQ